MHEWLSVKGKVSCAWVRGMVPGHSSSEESGPLAVREGATVVNPICRALRYLAAFLHLVPSPPGSSIGREAASLAQRGQLSASPARAGGLSSDRLMGPSSVPVGPPDVFSACKKPICSPGREAGPALPTALVPSGHSWPGGEGRAISTQQIKEAAAHSGGAPSPASYPHCLGMARDGRGPSGPPALALPASVPLNPSTPGFLPKGGAEV